MHVIRVELPSIESGEKLKVEAKAHHIRHEHVVRTRAEFALIAGNTLSRTCIPHESVIAKASGHAHFGTNDIFAFSATSGLTRASALVETLIGATCGHFLSGCQAQQDKKGRKSHVAT